MLLFLRLGYWRKRWWPMARSEYVQPSKRSWRGCGKGVKESCSVMEGCSIKETSYWSSYGKVMEDQFPLHGFEAEMEEPPTQQCQQLNLLAHTASLLALSYSSFPPKAIWTCNKCKCSKSYYLTLYYGKDMIDIKETQSQFPAFPMKMVSTCRIGKDISVHDLGEPLPVKMDSSGPGRPLEWQAGSAIFSIHFS